MAYPERIMIYPLNPNAPQSMGGNAGALAGQQVGSGGNSNGIGLFGNNGAPAPTANMFLQALMGGAPNTGALSQSRYNSALSLTPPPSQMGIGERLMRVGAAGLTQEGQPANQMLAAAMMENANVDQLNRDAAMAEYQAKVKALAPFIKQASKDTNASSLNAAAVPDTAAVMYNIDRALPRIQEDIDGYLNSWFGLGGTATGALGNMISLVGGTDAADLQAKLDTIKGNIGFDKLQRMRDASPTGGALGQVSQMELQQLNASLGNLNLNQSPEQLKQNLMDVRRYYVSSVTAIYKEYEEAFRKGLINSNDWEVIKLKLAPAFSGDDTSRTAPSTSTTPDYDSMSDDEVVDSILGN